MNQYYNRSFVINSVWFAKTDLDKHLDFYMSLLSDRMKV